MFAKKTVLVLLATSAASLVLTGCEKVQSVEYYTANFREIKPTLELCIRTKGPASLQTNQNCRNAAEAAHRIRVQNIIIQRKADEKALADWVAHPEKY
ncbi:MAG: EexN family lipoprotein [Burkholderiales bacterium]